MYDKDLATRINQQLAGLFDIEETRMFGGIAYMLNGNMCLAIWESFLICGRGHPFNVSFTLPALPSGQNANEVKKMGKHPILLLSLIIMLAGIVGLGANKKEAAIKEREHAKHRYSVHQAVKKLHPNLLEADAYIGNDINSDHIVTFQYMVVTAGYECPTISSARFLVWNNGFKVVCNRGRYRYEVEDVGGNWIVTVE